MSIDTQQVDELLSSAIYARLKPGYQQAVFNASIQPELLESLPEDLQLLILTFGDLDVDSVSSEFLAPGFYSVDDAEMARRLGAELDQEIADAELAKNLAAGDDEALAKHLGAESDEEMAKRLGAEEAATNPSPDGSHVPVVGPGIIICPHPGCKSPIEIAAINCKIFRHGWHFTTAPDPVTGEKVVTLTAQMNPHTPQKECERLIAAGEIVGCGLPLHYDGTNVTICGYI